MVSYNPYLTGLTNQGFVHCSNRVVESPNQKQMDFYAFGCSGAVCCCFLVGEIFLGNNRCVSFVVKSLLLGLKKVLCKSLRCKTSLLLKSSLSQWTLK